MRKLFNRIFKKKSKEIDFLSSIGMTYIKECQNNKEFRRKMEKTKFGQAVKQHIIEFRKQAQIDGKK